MNVKRRNFGHGAPEHRPHVPSVTESRVGLLNAQKANKRQGWWKGKFVLCWMLARGWGGVACSKVWLSPLMASQWAELLYWRRGYMQVAQSALTVIWILVIGGPDQGHLVSVQLIFS